MNKGCICKGNWRFIVNEYHRKIGSRFKDERGEYVFFGLVHGEDDYYYGLLRDDGRLTLVSCCVSLELVYEPIPQ